MGVGGRGGEGRGRLECSFALWGEDGTGRRTSGVSTMPKHVCDSGRLVGGALLRRNLIWRPGSKTVLPVAKRTKLGSSLEAAGVVGAARSALSQLRTTG